MSITNLTIPYSTPYQVSADDIDLIKIRSLETSPLTHEDLDDNFANLMNKVNALVDIIGGSSAAISVDGSGNVGIGTASPDQKLHIKEQATVAHGIFIENDGGIVRQILGTASDANHPSLRIKSNSTTLMTLMDNGNVGIGTTNPANKLEIAGNVRINGGEDTGSQLVQWCDNNGHANIAAFDIFFKTGQNQSRTDSMLINSDGNVGIGTTNPINGKLEVWGASSGSNQTEYVDLAITQDANITASKVQLRSGVASGTDPYFAILTRNNNGISNEPGVIKERMRIDSAGNVGIGTTSPDYKLEVHGGHGTNDLVYTSFDSVGANPQFGFHKAGMGRAATIKFNDTLDPNDTPLRYSIRHGNYATTSYEDTDVLQIHNATGEVITLTQGGNVGIGTTEPDTSLHISSDAGINGLIKLESSDIESSIVFKDNGSTGIVNVGCRNDDLKLRTDAGNITFFTHSASTERMRITSDGNVGIGTTSPDVKLHLSGNASSIIRLENNDLSVPLDRIIGGLEFEKADPSAPGAGVVGGLRMYSADEFGQSTYLALSTTSTTTLDEEAMRIDSNGNVGIGTTSPIDALLHLKHAKGAATDGFNALKLESPDPTILLSDSTNTGDMSIMWQAAPTSTGLPNQDGGLIFYRDGDVSDVNFMINTDGNVGIGTGSPRAKFDIRTKGDTPDDGLIVKSQNGGQRSIRMWVDGANDKAHIGAADGTEDLILNANGGNVGIGTTTPDRLMHLASNTAIICIEDTAGATDDKRAQIQVDDGKFEINSRNDDNSNRTDNIFVADLGTGNVGIGTTEPKSKLHISTDPVIILSDTTGGEDEIPHHRAIVNNLNLLNFGKYSQDFASYESHLVIDSDGRVGIGTTSPSAKLHIPQGSTIAGIDLSNACVLVGTSITGIGIDDNEIIKRQGANGGQLNIGSQGANASIKFKTGADTDNGDVAFDRMTIDSDGNVGIGTSPSAKLTVNGSLSKSSGSFRIDHPIKPETHDLVHSFVEAPQADNIYRGKVDLVAGKAEVNIDSVAGMTEGTFVLLNREIQVFTSNESDWDAVRGRVEGNKVIIECQNTQSTATISWLVIGERQDKHMYDTEWTDENGKVIVEPLKPEPAPEPKVETESEEVITEEPVAEEEPVEEPQVEELQPEEVAQVSLGQVSLGQVSLGQVSLGQVSLGQVSLSESPLDEIKEIRAEDGKEYVRIGDKEYEVLGENEDGSLVLDDDVTNNG